MCLAKIKKRHLEGHGGSYRLGRRAELTSIIKEGSISTTFCLPGQLHADIKTGGALLEKGLTVQCKGEQQHGARTSLCGGPPIAVEVGYGQFWCCGLRSGIWMDQLGGYGSRALWWM